MPKGDLNIAFTFNAAGDLLSVFQPIGRMLSHYNTKLVVPINLFNRRCRKVKYAVLELLVESRRAVPEWKLKLDNVNITRQFKPTHFLVAGEGERGLYKFVYDVTSILNAHEILSKEWINVLVKYEGGEPFTVRYLLMDAIYEDQDAYVSYRHSTGLLLLEGGERYSFPLEEFSSRAVDSRLIIYAPKQAEVKISTDRHNLVTRLPQGGVEDYTLTFNEGAKFIEVELGATKHSYAILSSITAYRCLMREPKLELCSVDYAFSGNKLVLKLKICNKGESSPDKLIVSVLRKGNVLRSLHVPQANVPPGGFVEHVVDLPSDRLDEINVRLIWLKSTRRWLRDEVLKL